MDPRELEKAKERLAILTALQVAGERRHEVIDAVWNSSDDDEASQRLRELVDIAEGASPRVILDQQIQLLTKERRDALAAEISDLRKLVHGPE